MKKYLAALLVSLGLSWPCAGAAAEAEPDLKAASWKLVTLKNGVNSVDLNSDGHADMIVVGWRENYNAHGFQATTMYIWAPPSQGRPDPAGTLHIVPIDGEETPRKKVQSRELVLQSAGGADGLLHDFRLLVDATNRAAVLVTATRQFGSSFADRRPVTFDYYRLSRNEEGLPGWAAFHFQWYRKEKSKKAHQDVNDAFKEELGIESDGR